MADIEILRECGDGKEVVYERFDHPEFEGVKEAEKWVKQDYQPVEGNDGRLLIIRAYRDLNVALKQVTQKEVSRNNDTEDDQ